MSTSVASPEGANPLAPLERLVHWLVASTVDIALGLLVGMIVARLIRSRHLHWSWAAPGLGLLALAKPAFGGSTLVLGVAALSAIVWGRRWHREDLDAGADLAKIAASRWEPLDVLRSLAHRARQRTLNQTADRWLNGDGLVLGYDQRGRATSIPFGGASAGTHTLVVGSTGSGKTVTQSWITVRAIECGMAAVVVDPKGDRSLRGEVLRAARVGKRPLVEWTPGGPSVYNPYARGSETEITDRVLAGERFTEPHYLRQAQRHLAHVVRVLRKLGVEVSLSTIVHHLDPLRLEWIARSLPEPDAEATHAYLDALTRAPIMRSEPRARAIHRRANTTPIGRNCASPSAADTV